MLSRIVPFLVWFHRYSPLVGRQPVPSMRELLPEARLRPALVLHTSAAVAGLAAIAAGDGHRAVGVLVAATGAVLLANLVTTLSPEWSMRSRRPSSPPQSRHTSS